MIGVRNLDFTYGKSGIRAVKEINFEIKSGEIFGFLGPNGAGKTTTQRLIIGLLSGYNGSIEIMDKERREWDNSFYEHIGVAFDFPNLYNKLTGKENLLLLSAYYNKKPLNIEGLFEKVGLEKDLDQRVESYSKGMKMRLNFIRAIMNNPDILFFDEPTSGLDPVNSKIIKDTIMQLKDSGKTIFLTTHNMTVAQQICDRVAFINEGQINAIDTPSNLMINHGRQVLEISYLTNDLKQKIEFELNAIPNNEDFYDIINNKKIITMHTKEATLEDVFIKYTGRKLK